MTLGELLELLGNNPVYIIGYFCLIPFTALVAGLLGKGEGHLSPWKYLYSTLIYLVCVPGIFAITLNIYLFLFQKRDIFETGVFTQILPILSMIVTLMIIKNIVNLDRIPGFGKLSGMMMLILAVLLLMWGLASTRIYIVAFINMPFYFVILIFIGLLVMMKLGWSRFFGASKA